MAGFGLQEATISGIHAAIGAGDLTAAGLVRGYLARIEAYDRSDPALNAILALNDQALARAEELDQLFVATGEFAGPLHGIPVALKDNILTADMPATFGSIAMEGYRPSEDATVTRRLREAGAIVLAKTALPDWASSWFSYSSLSGSTKNPYDPGRDPGGSSAGTGAAVAANLCAAGLGTDCGGSVRVPSSFCNLVGVRSTPGLVPRTGTSYLVLPQDTCGPMARTVTDAAKVFDVLAGYDPADPYSAAGRRRSYLAELVPDGLRGARLGMVTNALGSAGDREMAEVNEVVRAAAGAMRAAGAAVVEVEIPDLTEHIIATSMYTDRSKHDINLFLSGLAGPPARTLEEIYQKGQYHPDLDLMDAIMAGPEQPEEDAGYLRRFAARHQFTLAVMNVLAGHELDALIYPTVQVPPPTMDGRKQWTTLTFPTNTLIASQTWMPAITVPAGFTGQGMPAGLEFVAGPYHEGTLFRIGYGFEQATMHRRAPAACPELSSVSLPSRPAAVCVPAGPRHPISKDRPHAPQGRPDVPEVAMRKLVDFNADAGESFGRWNLGADAELIPYMSSVNVACGWHAGDPMIMRQSVRYAKQSGVALGAHPGLPDLAGFGRRAMSLSPEEAAAACLYQFGALQALASAEGVNVRHLKPHGALYGMTLRDPAYTEAITNAVLSVDPQLIVVLLAGPTAEHGKRLGARVAREAFADLDYDDDGHIIIEPNPPAKDPGRCAAQAIGILNGTVTTTSGKQRDVDADTICIHGDRPNAVQIAQEIRRRFQAAGVRVAAMDDVIAGRG